MNFDNLHQILRSLYEQMMPLCGDMIPPHGLEVTYDKTVHVIFPAEVRYVDLGSPDLIAGKADGAENVIRVKATVRNFPNETNMTMVRGK